MKNLIKDKITTINGSVFSNIEYIVKGGNNGSSIIVPHVCNNINSFGAGFALSVAKHYPLVKENYHMLGSTFLKNNLGYTQYIEVLRDPNFGHKLIFANMIAQNGTINKNNPRPLNYLALIKSMVSINNFITKNMQDMPVQIHAPKFGSGLAGGNWNFIKELVQDIWKDIPVFIYQI